MRACFPILLLPVLTGCLDLPDFPSSSLVEGPRVLAIVAEPPEITPGAALTVHVLVAESEAFEVEFEICGGALDSAFGGSMQFGEQDEDDCSGERGSFVAGRAESDEARRAGGAAVASWTLPAAAIAPVFASGAISEQVLGDALPARTRELIRSSVGIPVLVQATVITEGRRLRAVKRVLLSENAAPHRNPPAPGLAFGRTEVRAAEDNPWSCASEDGSTLRVPAGGELELAPTVENGEEDWLEPYRVLDARGEVQERRERAFYSWYATGGDFDRQVTRSPLRNQLWTAPREAGPHRLWLVVRDGHGGASACGMDVTVDETL
jgi:hypothetical protein